MCNTFTVAVATSDCKGLQTEVDLASGRLVFGRLDAMTHVVVDEVT